MDSAREKDYLKKAGWWPLDEHETCWACKEMGDRIRGGHSTAFAVKVQKEFETIDRNGAVYYFIADKYGYGYFIGKYTEKMGTPTRTCFDHLTKSEAEKLVTKLNKDAKYEPILGIDYQENEFPLLAVFSEKYGKRHFLAPTRSILEKVALKVVQERHDEGYYEFSTKEPKPPKIALNDTNGLGDKVKWAVKQEWDDYNAAVEVIKQNRKHNELLQNALKGVGHAALTLLHNMKDAEYEGFEVIEAETV